MTFEQIEAAEPASTARNAAGRARLFLGLLLLAAVIAVAVDNRRTVRVGYVVGDARAPMVLVLAIAMLAGALIGWLVLHRPHHSHRT
jgi:uncharacterized integral membrane protein